MSSNTNSLHGNQFLLLENDWQHELENFVCTNGGEILKALVRRELPVPSRLLVQEVANAAITAQLDGLILSTGVGTNDLLEIWNQSVGPNRVEQIFDDIEWVIASDQAKHELHKQKFDKKVLNLQSTDCRSVLQWLDQGPGVGYQCVAVERTAEFSQILAGLEARGAKVMPIPLNAHMEIRSNNKPDAQPVNASSVFIFVCQKGDWNLLDAAKREIGSSFELQVIVAGKALAAEARQLGYTVAATIGKKDLSALNGALARDLARCLW